MTDDELIGLAREAQRAAYAPYSGFRVGAALLARDGRVFTGVNVENASIRALRVRGAERDRAGGGRGRHGVREARRRHGRAEEPTMPCGVCRQVIWEFAHDLRISSSPVLTRGVHTTIAELFPRPFTSFKS